MSGAKWETVKNVAAFLAERGTKRTRIHAFTKRACHWAYCHQCGLVLLRNEVSRKAAKADCVTYE